MLEYRILGPLEVLRDGEAVLIGAAKQRTLLAALVVAAPHRLSADTLADVVWEDSPPPSARKLVQVYVSKLRAVLGAEAITTEVTGYRLDARPEQIDAVRFERLIARATTGLDQGNPSLAHATAGSALELWRGSPLTELADAAGEVTRLEALKLDAETLRVGAELALGRNDEALAAATRLAAAHPLDERLCGYRALALYRVGRQADALAAIAETRRRLQDELGLSPGAGIRRLEQEILTHDSSLDPVPAAVRRSGRVPTPGSSLVGRQQELASLRELVEREDVRLVTIVGPGGSGKTRLALAAASGLEEGFPDGAAFVELAAVRDESGVTEAIARALAVGETPEQTTEARLTDALATMTVLLVVDNFEHLVEAAPRLSALLESSPGLMLVVTSRRVLHVTGEHVFPLGPLSEDDAVDLFVARASAADTRHVVAGHEHVVLEICRRLDCLPLGIELAAARTAILSPAALLERLEESVTALGPGPRDAPARQQTLADTIAWSTALLSDDERRALGRMSVFAGGCTLKAAEAVCDAPLETIMALLDASLLRRDPAAGDRLSMLETIREQAALMLDESGEREAAESSHAGFFGVLVEELARPAREGTHYGNPDEIDIELDNLRVAHDRLLGAGEPDRAVRLATALRHYWYVRGLFREGRNRISRSLSDATEPALAASAKTVLAGLSWQLGEMDEAEAHARGAVTQSAVAGALEPVIGAETVLGLVARHRGDLVAAAEAFERSRTIALGLGREVDTMVANTNLADLALAAGDLDQAERRLQTTLDWNAANGRTADDTFALLGLGVVAFRRESFAIADGYWAKALAVAQAAGFAHGIALAQIGLAAVAASDGRHARAAELLGEASRLLEATGGVLTEIEHDLFVRAETTARRALGAESFALSFGSG
ncbi:MAG: BTAD domain-containing putative transcriptional regulator [Gaiellales bacterium]